MGSGTAGFAVIGSRSGGGANGGAGFRESPNRSRLMHECKDRACGGGFGGLSGPHLVRGFRWGLDLHEMGSIGSGNEYVLIV